MRKFKLSGISRFILAVILPLIAFILQWNFWHIVRPSVWVFFYPAVFFSAWVDGLRGGIVATLIAAALREGMFGTS